MSTPTGQLLSSKAPAGGLGGGEGLVFLDCLQAKGHSSLTPLLTDTHF